ncbi:MAG TPA: YggU family protein, partial [Gammaproteobacteria bacterium]|nr:YggU family protein [Gammaproteobacteria bacterium]
VNSPPIQGKANARLRQFLAAAFGCRQRDVELVNGEYDRDKVVRIHGVRMIPAALS